MRTKTDDEKQETKVSSAHNKDARTESLLELELHATKMRVDARYESMRSG